MEITGTLETIRKAMEGHETALPASCEMSAIERMLATPNLTRSDCKILHELVSRLPDNFVPRATPEQIAEHLSFMASTLPSKNTDVEAGQERFVVYAGFLRDYSDSALAFMAKQACKTHDWFPTPRQCLAILKEWSEPRGIKERGLRKLQDMAQVHLEQFIDELRTTQIEQAIIDAQPDGWQRIAMERGYLRWSDGKYIQRNPIKGPS